MSVSQLMLMILVLGGLVTLALPVLRSWWLRDHMLRLGLETETTQEAVAAIRRMGGQVHRDENRPGTPVTAVELRGLNISEPGLVHLGPLHDLESLRIEGADIGDGSFSHLAKLVNLRQLTLSNTWVAGTGLMELAALRRLEYLDLSLNPRLTDASAERLSRLSFLKTLNLSHTGVTERVATLLRGQMPNTAVIH